MFRCRTDARIFPWKSGMKAFIVFQSEVEEGPITSAELEVKSLKVRDRELVRAKSLVFFGNDAYWTSVELVVFRPAKSDADVVTEDLEIPGP